MPPRHPFNPLAAQRLLIALGASDDAVASAFDFVFGEGRDPEHEFAALAKRLGVSDGAAMVASPEVKYFGGPFRAPVFQHAGEEDRHRLDPHSFAQGPEPVVVQVRER